MSGLRVCMVTTFYPPHNFGGDGIAVQRLARALVKRGHEVTVLANSDAFAVLGGAAAADDAGDGITVHRLASPVPAVSVLVTQQTGGLGLHRAAIRDVLRPGRFDVIHYHNISLVGGPSVLAEGGRDAIKLYTAHAHWLVCPTHVLWRHRREPCTGRECLRCQLAYHRPPQLWRHTGHLERNLGHVDTFIAQSQFSRDKHREMGFPRDMVIVPPILDDEPLAHPVPASPHPRPYFLYVGRLERLKGLDDVIPVAREYADADLVIVGDGTHRAALEAIAGGSERVRFVGRVPTEQLDPYYSHALAVLVPSEGYETFGFVAIEAFRRSAPVIARRQGPLVEFVESSGGGELFITPAELRDQMRRMQSDASRRHALGRAGRAAFVDLWSEQAVMPRYLAVIERAAEARGAARVLEALGAGRAA